MFTRLIDGAVDAAPEPDAAARFFRLLRTALAEGSFGKLTLSGYRGTEPDLQRVMVRAVQLKGVPSLSLVYRHATRDLTRNQPVEEALAHLQTLLGADFHNAHLHTAQQEVQLAYSRKGRPSLRVAGSLASESPAAPPGHNRDKQYLLRLAAPQWQGLGLTDAQQRLVPAMARKWKQINKFAEILVAALAASPLGARDPAEPVRVADFGAGKGYLTFAVHAVLRQQGRAVQVTGVELRPDLVQLCNDVAQRHALQGLRFEPGDIGSHQPGALDVMIALHACDTATDLALYLGLQAGASILMCSPCCHKQLRPQMQLPSVLRPMLHHGIHLGQEAEMVTDSLRALLLEAHGYDTQVFEFISLEHTAKNKMILAVKRATPLAAARRDELLRQIAEIKAFYGIREQQLEALLAPA
ncbi:MAG: SAM-dependent methyltransferase [Burkholderiales bacterium]